MVGVALLGVTYFAAKAAFAAILASRKALKGVKIAAESEQTKEKLREAADIAQEAVVRAETLAKRAKFGIRQNLSFSGKSSRRDFIVVMLVGNFLIGIPLGIGLLAMKSDWAFLAILGVITVVAMLIASIWLTWAASSRRMRDTGVNAWWVLALLVPPLNIAATVFLLLVPTGEFEGRGL